MAPIVSETKDMASSSMFAFLDGLDYVPHASLLSNPGVDLPGMSSDAEHDSLHFTLGHCKILHNDGAVCLCLTSISHHQQNIFIEQLSLDFDC